ncbi:MAG: hypothetical protein JWN35_1947 [Frankiales bacterium]|nr:hypothetical protein [Frankiales bacterium]
MIHDVPATAGRLTALRSLGVRLSLDDFGTGYSSLAMLIRLPVDGVKVDRSFVRGMASDPAKATLVQLIIVAAHALNLTAIAEGVETVDELTALQAMGCDAVQGYLLGRPMRPEELAAHGEPLPAILGR